MYLKLQFLPFLTESLDIEELPFYDAERHDVMDDEERRQAGAALREYRENLRTGTKPGDE